MSEISTDRIIILNQIGVVEKRLSEENLSKETIRHLNERLRELNQELEQLRRKP